MGKNEFFPKTVGKIKGWPRQVTARMEQAAEEEPLQGWASAATSDTPPLDSVCTLRWVWMGAGARVQVNTALSLISEPSIRLKR